VYTDMQQWSEIRRRVLVEGLSKRAACREYGLHWHTLTKMLGNSEPPGYRAAQPRAKRKIGPFLAVIAEILKQDQACLPTGRRPRVSSGTASGGSSSG